MGEVEDAGIETSEKAGRSSADSQLLSVMTFMHRIVKLALANIQAFHPSNFKQIVIVKTEHSLMHG